MTGNAVRPQLQRLEQEGIVRVTGTRPGAGAGKPATHYAIAPSAEPVLSAAYTPVHMAPLDAVAERMSPEVLDEMLRDLGRRVQPTEPPGGSLDTRIRAAASLRSALGGAVDVERTPTDYLLRGFPSSLAAAVRSQPNACHAIEELVAAMVGMPVRECCDRSEVARCGFEVLASTT